MLQKILCLLVCYTVLYIKYGCQIYDLFMPHDFKLNNCHIVPKVQMYHMNTKNISFSFFQR